MPDAKLKIVKTVNFGRGLSGRRNFVNYEVFNTLGTGSISPTNAGVYEISQGSGIYGAQLLLSQSFSGSIVWHVTGSNSSIVYAVDELEVDSRVTRHMTTGQWQIDPDEKQMIFYQEDNETEFARFDLQDRNGNASFEEVFKRIRK